MVIVEIKRNIINRLYDDLSDRKPSILVGARQVGKTFLLKKVEDEARARGLRVKKFDLELPSDIVSFNKTEADVFKLLTEDCDVVFLDEFHYLKNASHLFKAVYDSECPVKIYASGSSSLEIHKHIKESLAGRKLLHRIFPCSADEILSTDKMLSINDYLVFGGMPGLIHYGEAEKKKELLKDILQSYILKDIKGLIREENIRAFNNLLYLLAQNQGQLVSTSELSKEVGLTAKTVELHLEIMTNTYVLYSLPCYSNNLGNELKKSRKFYLYDLGIRNILLKDFRFIDKRPDAGQIIESFVFLELVKRIVPEVEIRFWRTKAGDEVDFIWIKNRIPYPIEVKTKDLDGQIPRGLKIFLGRYPKTPKAFVLHGGAKIESKIGDTDILFLPWRDAFNGTVTRLSKSHPLQF